MWAESTQVNVKPDSVAMVSMNSQVVSRLTQFAHRALTSRLLAQPLMFAIVLHVAEIIGHVRNGQQAPGKPVLRPSVDDDQVDDEVVQMMKRCWVEDPNERPDFPVLKATIRRLNK